MGSFQYPRIIKRKLLLFRGVRNPWKVGVFGISSSRKRDVEYEIMHWQMVNAERDPIARLDEVGKARIKCDYSPGGTSLGEIAET